MALVIVNQGRTPPERLWAAAAALPPGAPVIVMLHGYRFSPACPTHDPHAHILSLDPLPQARRAVSWPRALGFAAADDPREGLGVAFGWQARGSLRSAYGEAARAGAELAGIIDALAVTARRPVALIGHSLGARVGLAAVSRAAPGAVSRLVLLAAAELRGPAEAAIASPAGMLAEVLNVTSRENDLFELGMELVLAAGLRRGIGFGLERPAENWLDLQIDDADTLSALELLGYPVSPRAERLSHWSPYLREGLFPLYRATLSRPESVPLRLLRGHLPAAGAPRWSRLWSRPVPGDGPGAGGAEPA